jgi:hypothetical protein
VAAELLRLCCEPALPGSASSSSSSTVSIPAIAVAGGLAKRSEAATDHKSSSMRSKSRDGEATDSCATSDCHVRERTSPSAPFGNEAGRRRCVKTGAWTPSGPISPRSSALALALALAACAAVGVSKNGEKRDEWLGFVTWCV